MIHSVVLQLEQSQWLPAEEIERRQLAQLRRLVIFAQRNVPFYEERLKPFAAELRRGPLTPEIWSEIPTLKRGDVQSAGSALRSRAVPRGHGQVTSTVTSGSTGEPIRIWTTAAAKAMWLAFNLRNHLWHRRDFAGALAMIRGRVTGRALYPEGMQSDNWGGTAAAGIPTGPLLVLDINCTPAQQVDWLVRKAPAYFITHPTNMQRLAQHSLEAGIRIPGLREAQTVAEVLNPEVRTLVRRAWGVKVVDMYTSRDAGYMALQCPEFDHYHIQAESCRHEILDPSGRPSGPGQVGQFLVTPLHNFAMPLIRYAIGDHAEAGAPCACGRSLPVIAGIVGRTQQMLTLPDGSKRWTLMQEAKMTALMGMAPIRQFQFVQKTLETMEARLAVERALTEAEEAKVKDWVAVNFGHPFAVDFRYLDEIPRTEEGKFFDFISEVAG